MFDSLGDLWNLWGIWTALKGSAMTPEQINTLLAILIPIVLPFITRYLKMLAPSMPKWLIVILQPLMGALAAALGDMTAGATVGPAIGAGLGVTGIGVREEVVKVGRAIGLIAPKGSSTPPVITPLV
jgi:hypothetical protein